MALTKVDQTMVSDQVFGRRNLIINGDMRVAQRGTSSTGVSSGGDYLTIDRFRFSMSSAGTWDISQSTTVPSGEGFAYSQKIDCTTADSSLDASNYLIYLTALEGQNLQHTKFGTSLAEKLTLSFWVRSAKTGTYVVEFINSAAGGTRTQSQSYTISSADTWEKKTITIDGDTATAFDNTTGAELSLYFWLAAGSNYTGGTLNTSWNSSTNANRAAGLVNLADSTSNDWYITGIQLEVGDNATPFEHLSLAEELALCQRYFMSTAYPNNFSSTQAYTTDGYWLYQGLCYYEDGLAHDMYQLPVTMRATPTPTPYAPSGLVSGYGGGSTKLAAYGAANASWKAADIHTFTWASTPNCSAYRVDYNNSSEDHTGGMWIGGFEFDAEL